MSTATVTAPAVSGRSPIYNSLFVQVLAALVLGIILGMAVPDFAISLKILSDGFLKLIQMIVAPIVFFASSCTASPAPAISTRSAASVSKP
jgi:aerobic C4-dicarboxylate transport protein